MYCRVLVIYLQIGMIPSYSAMPASSPGQWLSETQSDVPQDIPLPGNNHRRWFARHNNDGDENRARTGSTGTASGARTGRTNWSQRNNDMPQSLQKQPFPNSASSGVFRTFYYNSDNRENDMDINNIGSGQNNVFKSGPIGPNIRKENTPFFAPTGVVNNVRTYTGSGNNIENILNMLKTNNSFGQIQTFHSVGKSNNLSNPDDFNGMTKQFQTPMGQKSLHNVLKSGPIGHSTVKGNKPFFGPTGSDIRKGNTPFYTPTGKGNNVRTYTGSGNNIGDIMNMLKTNNSFGQIQTFHSVGKSDNLSNSDFFNAMTKQIQKSMIQNSMPTSMNFTNHMFSGPVMLKSAKSTNEIPNILKNSNLTKYNLIPTNGTGMLFNSKQSGGNTVVNTAYSHSLPDGMSTSNSVKSVIKPSIEVVNRNFSLNSLLGLGDEAIIQTREESVSGDQVGGANEHSPSEKEIDRIFNDLKLPFFERKFLKASSTDIQKDLKEVVKLWMKELEEEDVSELSTTTQSPIVPNTTATDYTRKATYRAAISSMRMTTHIPLPIHTTVTDTTKSTTGQTAKSNMRITTTHSPISSNTTVTDKTKSTTDQTAKSNMRITTTHSPISSNTTVTDTTKSTTGQTAKSNMRITTTHSPISSNTTVTDKTKSTTGQTAKSNMRITTTHSPISSNTTVTDTTKSTTGQTAKSNMRITTTHSPISSNTTVTDTTKSTTGQTAKSNMRITTTHSPISSNTTVTDKTKSTTGQTAKFNMRITTTHSPISSNTAVMDKTKSTTGQTAKSNMRITTTHSPISSNTAVTDKTKSTTGQTAKSNMRITTTHSPISSNTAVTDKTKSTTGQTAKSNMRITTTHSPISSNTTVTDTTRSTADRAVRMTPTSSIVQNTTTDNSRSTTDREAKSTIRMTTTQSTIAPNTTVKDNARSTTVSAANSSKRMAATSTIALKRNTTVTDKAISMAGRTAKSTIRMTTIQSSIAPNTTVTDNQRSTTTQSPIVVNSTTRETTDLAAKSNMRTTTPQSIIAPNTTKRATTDRAAKSSIRMSRTQSTIAQNSTTIVTTEREATSNKRMTTTQSPIAENNTSRAITDSAAKPRIPMAAIVTETTGRPFTTSIVHTTRSTTISHVPETTTPISSSTTTTTVPEKVHHIPKRKRIDESSGDDPKRLGRLMKPNPQYSEIKPSNISVTTAAIESTTVKLNSTQYTVLTRRNIPDANTNNSNHVKEVSDLSKVKHVSKPTTTVPPRIFIMPPIITADGMKNNDVFDTNTANNKKKSIFQRQNQSSTNGSKLIDTKLTTKSTHDHSTAASSSYTTLPPILNKKKPKHVITEETNKQNQSKAILPQVIKETSSTALPPIVLQSKGGVANDTTPLTNKSATSEKKIFHTPKHHSSKSPKALAEDNNMKEYASKSQPMPKSIYDTHLAQSPRTTLPPVFKEKDDIKYTITDGSNVSLPRESNVKIFEKSSERPIVTQANSSKLRKGNQPTPPPLATSAKKAILYKPTQSSTSSAKVVKHDMNEHISKKHNIPINTFDQSSTASSPTMLPPIFVPKMDTSVSITSDRDYHQSKNAHSKQRADTTSRSAPPIIEAVTNGKLITSIPRSQNAHLRVYSPLNQAQEKKHADLFQPIVASNFISKLNGGTTPGPNVATKDKKTQITTSSNVLRKSNDMIKYITKTQSTSNVIYNKRVTPTSAATMPPIFVRNIDAPDTRTYTSRPNQAKPIFYHVTMPTVLPIVGPESISKQGDVNTHATNKTATIKTKNLTRSSTQSFAPSSKNLFGNKDLNRHTSMKEDMPKGTYDKVSIQSPRAKLPSIFARKVVRPFHETDASHYIPSEGKHVNESIRHTVRPIDTSTTSYRTTLPPIFVPMTDNSNTQSKQTFDTVFEEGSPYSLQSIFLPKRKDVLTNSQHSKSENVSATDRTTTIYLSMKGSVGLIAESPSSTTVHKEVPNNIMSEPSELIMQKEKEIPHKVFNNKRVDFAPYQTTTLPTRFRKVSSPQTQTDGKFRSVENPVTNSPIVGNAVEKSRNMNGRGNVNQIVNHLNLDRTFKKTNAETAVSDTAVTSTKHKQAVHISRYPIKGSNRLDTAIEHSTQIQEEGKRTAAHTAPRLFVKQTKEAIQSQNKTNVTQENAPTPSNMFAILKLFYLDLSKPKVNFKQSPVSNSKMINKEKYINTSTSKDVLAMSSVQTTNKSMHDELSTANANNEVAKPSPSKSEDFEAMVTNEDENGEDDVMTAIHHVTSPTTFVNKVDTQSDYAVSVKDTKVKKRDSVLGITEPTEFRLAIKLKNKDRQPITIIRRNNKVNKKLHTVTLPILELFLGNGDALDNVPNVVGNESIKPSNTKTVLDIASKSESQAKHNNDQFDDDVSISHTQVLENSGSKFSKPETDKEDSSNFRSGINILNALYLNHSPKQLVTS